MMPKSVAKWLLDRARAEGEEAVHQRHATDRILRQHVEWYFEGANIKDIVHALVDERVQDRALVRELRKVCADLERCC